MKYDHLKKFCERLYKYSVPSNYKFDGVKIICGKIREPDIVVEFRYRYNTFTNKANLINYFRYLLNEQDKILANLIVTKKVNTIELDVIKMEYIDVEHKDIVFKAKIKY